MLKVEQAGFGAKSGSGVARDRAPPQDRFSDGVGEATKARCSSFSEPRRMAYGGPGNEVR